MNYQSNRDRFRNIGGKSIAYRRYQEPDPLLITKQSIRPKFRTQTHDANAPDSLQLFQQQLNAAINSSKIKKKQKKSIKTADFRTNPSKQTIQIKNQVNQLKNMLESQTEMRRMQDKLQKLLIQIEDQKSKPKNRPVQNANTTIPAYQNFTTQVPFPMYQQPPMFSMPPYYPANYPYYPYPYQSDERPHKHRRKPKRYDNQDQDDSLDSNQVLKSNRNKKQSRNSFNPVRKRQKIRTKLRIYLFVAAFTIFIRKQSKKLSAMRKNNLKKFWSQKFESQINNIKNWILDSQKFSLSLILEKKNLSLNFFQQKSQRVRQQKQKFIMQVVNIGVSKMLDQTTPQKVSLFTQLLLNLCRSGSFGINKFWTVYEMEQICISEYYGFFRIDHNLQKFLIAVVIFIKIFIFNMFLQPYKFDSGNFPKKQQPITSNMKIISSVYYFMIKQLIYQYLNQNRDPEIYKTGNWLSVKKQFIVQCSQPLVYGSEYPSDDQYISGLCNQNDIIELKDHQSWQACVTKMKKIVEKLHSQTLAKGKMVKKNLKYKLYH